MREPVAVTVPKELYYHEVAYVRGLETQIAALRKELDQTKTLALAHFGATCSPTPDPAEAMRAKCADYVEQLGHPGCKFIAEAIRGAALKGNGAPS